MARPQILNSAGYETAGEAMAAAQERNAACEASLWMGLMSIAAGDSTEPGVHFRHTTALYLLQGELTLRCGSRLERERNYRRGEVLHVPAELPYQLINAGADEARLVVAKSGATPEGDFVRYLYPPAHLL